MANSKINGPFFSVIIPTLNEQKYLPKLLACLHRQLDKDFEVIVVDGLSEDKTVEAAQKFAGKVPGLEVIAGEARNVAKQRNIGAAKARGRFLVFWDADVLVPANFLSEIHYYLTEKDRRCKFLTTWMEADSKDSVDKLIMVLGNLGIELAKSLEKPFVAGFNMLVEKGAFKSVGGFNERWVPGSSEDHDLAQRLHKKGVVLQIVKTPKLTASLRRFRREGTLNTLRKYALDAAKKLAVDPMTVSYADYAMGGRVKQTPKTPEKDYFEGLPRLVGLWRNGFKEERGGKQE